MQGKNNGKRKSKQSEEKQRGQQLQSSFALLEHFRSSFSTCYIPFQSSRSQESNASNRVRFGAEMRKIWPSKTTAPGFSKYGCYVMAWMQSHGNFAPEVISYELLEGEVFNSKFCINPLEPISMAIESCACHIEYEIVEEAMNFMSYEHLVEECPSIPVVREMFDFVGAQKSINAHLSQRIDSVESSLNKMMDEIQSQGLPTSTQGKKKETFLLNLIKISRASMELIWPHPNKSMKQRMKQRKEEEEIKGKRKGIVSIAIIQCKSLMKDANFIWDPGKLKQDNIF
ncbi:hypothetical protein AAG906_013135 [Vitis piasezkii]